MLLKISLKVSVHVGYIICLCVNVSVCPYYVSVRVANSVKFSVNRSNKSNVISCQVLNFVWVISTML